MRRRSVVFTASLAASVPRSSGGRRSGPLGTGRHPSALIKSLRRGLSDSVSAGGALLRISVPGGAVRKPRRRSPVRRVELLMDEEFRRFFGRDARGLRDGAWTYPPDPSWSRSTPGPERSSFHSFRVDVTVEKRGGKYRLASVRPVSRGSEAGSWTPFSGVPYPGARRQPPPRPPASPEPSAEEEERRREVRARHDRLRAVLRELEKAEERLRAQRAEKGRTARARGDSDSDGDGHGSR